MVESAQILEQTFTHNEITIPTEPNALAAFITLNPHLLTDVIDRTHAALSIALLGDETADSTLSSHFLAVNRAIDQYDWRQETGEFTLSFETATLLLDTLVETKNSESLIDQRLHNTIRKVINTHINRRFGVSHNWEGALTTLHTFTEAAFTDTENLPRIEAWMRLFSEREEIFSKKSTARQSVFLAFHNPSVEAEPYLKMAMDIQYAYFSAAKVFKIPSRLAPLEHVDDLEHLLGQQIKMKTPMTLFSDTVTAIQRFPEKTTLLRTYLKTGNLAAFRFDPTQFSESSLKEKIRFPEYVFLRETFVTKQASEMLKDLFDEQDTNQRLKSRATNMGPHAKIIKFNADISGYCIVPDEVAGTFDRHELQAYAVQMLEIHNIRQKLEESKALSKNPRIYGLEIMLPGIYFMIKKDQYREKTPLEAYFDLMLPESLQVNGLSILEELVRMKPEVAHNFTHSLTRAGVAFELAGNENLPGVFSSAQLALREPGVFTFSLTPSVRPDLGFTTLQPITGAITLHGGRAELHFESTTVSEMPVHLTWFLSREILRLFRSQCCLPHEEIPFLREHVVEGEVRPINVDIPGMLVHIGATKKSGDPGMFTMRALINHAYDVYGLQLPEDITLEEAVLAIKEIKGMSLVDINILHNKAHRGCPKNLTWRVSHTTEFDLGEPAHAEVPGDLFTL